MRLTKSTGYAKFEQMVSFNNFGDNNTKYIIDCLNRLKQYEDLFEQMDKETFGLMEMIKITDKIIEIGKGE